ncbi:MAG: hypothetical protein M1838_003925 [Thelocarpon superellum]|nr:MAG: hypothetical protein M1838_003925 [Thelocarpon superellum]
MRWLLSTSLLSLLVVSPLVAAEDQSSEIHPAKAEGVSIQTAPAVAPGVDAVKAEVKAATDSTGEEEEDEDEDEEPPPPPPTVFNGVEVPALREISGEQFDAEVKDGYWSIAPTLFLLPGFTLYEFYYTSKPIGSSKSSIDSQSSLNAFHPYYNFHFGSLDCVAFGAACEQHGVHSFPTFILYKDGSMVKKYDGDKTMQGLSAFIEDTLESIRPGSRPKEGVKLPEVGAHGIEADAKPDVPAAKDKDAAAGAAAGKEHNEKAAQEPTLAQTETLRPTKSLRPTKVKQTVMASKPTSTPNEAGASVPLSAQGFQNLVTTTQDPWFIKFYAPWCHHCQAMAPNWAELGRDMKHKLNIGEVNCDAETRLCRDVRVKGYPTVLFFKGGERVEYDGLRGVGDLVNFANKATDIGEGVRDVDAAAFQEMEKTEEVIFVYFYDHATTTEDFAALDRVLLSLIGHAKLVKTNDPAMSDRFKISTWPRLMVARDGRPSYYSALAPQDIRDYRKVLGWMKSVWLPIVPELTPSNAREIMDGKVVVLGILSRERADEFVIARREMKNAALEWMDKQTQEFQRERQERRGAKQLRIEEAEDRSDQRALRAAKSIRVKMDEYDRKQVGFAWVDGIFWERWIRTTYGIEVKDGEKVIVNDEDNHRYWDTTMTGNYIAASRTSILETLPHIVASPPRLKAKSTTSAIETMFFELRGAITSHPWITLGLLVGIFAGLAVWGRGRIRRGKGSFMNGAGSAPAAAAAAAGFFKLDGKEGLLGGGAGNGKVD